MFIIRAQLLMSDLPSGNGSTLKKHSVPPAGPLDLRCTSEHGRSPAATVSRRCAPHVVPANTAPSTSLPRGGSSSIVTTLKVNRRQSSSSGQSAAAAANWTRKRSRDSASSASSSVLPSEVEKQARMSSQALGHSSPSPQSTATTPMCVQMMSSGSESTDERLALSSSHPAVAVAGLGGDSVAASSAVSLPVVLTSVNGMLVPLSSAPATIIVVNCATASTLPPSPSSSRLCPIAPAPPSLPKQSTSSTVASSPVCLSSTDTDAAAATTPSSPTAQRRTYTCEEPGCGKMYFKNSHLKVHRRVHTGMTWLSLHAHFRLLFLLLLPSSLFWPIFSHFYIKLSCTAMHATEIL